MKVSSLLRCSKKLAICGQTKHLLFIRNQGFLSHGILSATISRKFTTSIYYHQRQEVHDAEEVNKNHSVSENYEQDSFEIDDVDLYGEINPNDIDYGNEDNYIQKDKNPPQEYDNADNVDDDVDVNDDVDDDVFINDRFIDHRKVLGKMEYLSLVRRAIGFTEVVKKHLQQGDIDSAIEHFTEYKKMEHIGLIRETFKMYRLIIIKLCENERAEEAIKLLNEAVSFNNIKLRFSYFTPIIISLFRIGDLDRGLELCEQVKNSNVEGDRMILDTVAISGYLTAGRLEEAEDIFEDIFDGMTYYEEVLIEVMIKGYCDLGRLDKIRKLFDRMNDRGWIDPDTGVVNRVMHIAIYKFCNLNGADFAVNLMKEMSELYGYRPNSFTYVSIIDKYCKEEKLTEAYEILDQVKKNPYIEITDIIFNPFVNVYCKLGEIEKAFGIVLDMEAHGVNPSVSCYTTLLDGCLKKDKFKVALTLFEKMIKNDVKPNVITFGSFIFHLTSKGKLNEALEFYSRMKKMSIPPNTLICNMLLDALAKKDLNSVAFDFFNNMKKEIPKPNVGSYNIMIKISCRSGDIHTAVELFEEMQSNYLKPDIITYNTLLGLLCQHRILNKAEKLFGMMKKQGIQPDVKTYTSMMNGYCKKNMIGKAEELYNEMLSNDITPDNHVFVSLLKTYAFMRNYEAAKDVVKRLKSFGLQPNDVINKWVRVAHERTFEE